MQQQKYFSVFIAGVLALAILTTGCLRRKKYENPITKDTLQPDKVLFDRAMGDIEHGRYEVARLTLNTLINTYDSSEFLAKAKLAIADSWFREGGSHGLAQAEAEYKDFQLFYPNMQESAESQMKICTIHFKQMEKADRDNSQAQRAEDECRQVMVQYPNSVFVKQAEQMLRSTQEVLAEKEFRTGSFYHTKGSYPAAANRLSYLTQQYPLYSGADEALWQLADSYKRMGDRFENQSADAYTKLVREYPLSARLDEAKAELQSLKRPVPQADPTAYARMKYDRDNYVKPSILQRSVSAFVGRPDTSYAAKTGAPAMQTLRPPVPVSVPPAAAGASGVSDVTASTVTDTTALDTQKDARIGQANANGAPAAAVPAAGDTTAPANGAAASTPSTPAPAAAESQPQQQLPSNHSLPPTKKQRKQKAKKADKPAPAAPTDTTAKPASQE